MVEVAIQPYIPRLVEWGKLSMLDEWANIVVTSEPPEFLIVVSLVTVQDRNRRYVPFHYLWPRLPEGPFGKDK
jgi:hypothetical protein